MRRHCLRWRERTLDPLFAIVGAAPWISNLADVDRSRISRRMDRVPVHSRKAPGFFDVARIDYRAVRFTRKIRRQSPMYFIREFHARKFLYRRIRLANLVYRAQDFRTQFGSIF